MVFNSNFNILTFDNINVYINKYYTLNGGVSKTELSKDIKTIEFINIAFRRFEEKDYIKPLKLFNIIKLAINIFGVGALDILYFLTKYEYHLYLTTTLYFFNIINNNNFFFNVYKFDNEFYEILKINLEDQ